MFPRLHFEVFYHFSLFNQNYYFLPWAFIVCGFCVNMIIYIGMWL